MKKRKNGFSLIGLLIVIVILAIIALIILNIIDEGKLSLGKEVFFDPVANEICKGYTKANSNTGVKTGCMRWYVYKIDGDNVGLILDHNTTATTNWISPLDYLIEGDYDAGNCSQSACNDRGSRTLNKQLKEDTIDQGWQVSASVITIEDLMNMLPWYQNLEDKSNWLEYYNINMFNDVNENVVESNYATRKAYTKAIINYLNTNHSDKMLPSYMYEDILINDCTDDMNCITSGYWTSDADLRSNFSAWYVDYFGFPYDTTVSKGGRGVRPVITLSKSVIE